jgi:hypothetical protein
METHFFMEKPLSGDDIEMTGYLARASVAKP